MIEKITKRAKYLRTKYNTDKRSVSRQEVGLFRFLVDTVHENMSTVHFQVYFDEFTKIHDILNDIKPSVKYRKRDGSRESAIEL